MNDKPPSTSGTGSTSLITRLRRAFRGEPWSREEIQDIIQQSETDIDAEEKSMLTGVLEVSETQVRDVMIPRSQMIVIDIDDDFDAMLRVIVESGHSRFPVIGEDRDEVLGVLLAKDLLRYFGSDAAKNVPIGELLRHAAVIPESKRLNALLKEFRDSHNHMAIVVDEYGGTAGVVTLEDIIEEIVGEIQDEYDIEEKQFRLLPDEKIIADGRVQVSDLEEILGVHFPDDTGFETLAGFLMFEAGYLPAPGAVIEWNGLCFTVKEGNEKRIATVEIERRRRGAEASGEGRTA